jgi:multidrug resistance efflux pump
VIAGVDTTADAFDTAEKAVYERKSVLSDSERQAYNTYRASVRSAQALVKNARGNFTLAEEQYRSAQAITAETVRVGSAEVSRATGVQSGELEVSEATVQELYAQLQTLETALGEGVVRAPYAGVVTDVLVAEGASVTQGTPLVRMHSVGGYEVEVTVAPQHLHTLQPGVEARFTDGSRGVVDRVAPQVQEGAGGASVFVTLEQAVLSHVSGMRIRGELMVPARGEYVSLYLIPHEYIAFDWSGPVVRTEQGTIQVLIVRDTKEGMYVSGADLREGMALVR